MIALETLAAAALGCALWPAALFCVNLWRYRTPANVGGTLREPISVLIPARNEERSIRAALDGALQSTGVEFEIVVMDDGSTDGTVNTVSDVITRANGRVRLEQAPALPRGWNGKQHACWALAHVARYDVLCFVDADVRLEAEAIARMLAHMERSGAALVSGFPRQITDSWMEALLLPLIHFVLLGFLPIGRMRSGTNPAFAAGCGQFLMVRRAAYEAAGGHSGIRETMHDGLRLPRLMRERGYRTELADLTDLAHCRMYTGAAEVWQGLAKNATEGLGAPGRILPITLLLLLGQVAPFVLAFALAAHGERTPWITALVVLGMIAAWLPRVLAVRRFKQPLWSAVLHPVGITVLLALQWYALARKLIGGTVSWRGRDYVGSKDPA